MLDCCILVVSLAGVMDIYHLHRLKDQEFLSNLSKFLIRLNKFHQNY